MIHPFGWYFITVAAAARGRNVFATLSPGGFEPTALGRLVEREWRALCARRGSALVTHAFQVMPDHVHALVHLAGSIPRSLGGEIGGWKAAVLACARRELGFVKDKPLWKPGYDCERKKSPQEIASARLYAQRNPSTAREKRAAKSRWGAPAPLAHPRLPDRWPDGSEEVSLAWTAFGDPALLDAENLVAVRVSRHEPESRLKRIEERAASLAKDGAVLVSPALSPGERRALSAALRAGGRAIHLECRPIDRYYKSLGPRLSACTQGKLLALSPLSSRRPLEKPLAEALNALAKEIAD